MKRWHVSFAVPNSDMRDFTHVVKETQEEAETFVKEHHGQKPIAVEEAIAATCTRDCGYQRQQAKVEAEAPDLERARRVINGLLRLASGNTTEDEAMLAMTKAQEMMAQYNLTLEQVLAAGGGTPADKTIVMDATMENKSNSQTWKRALFYTVALSNFCRYITVTYKLYGQKGGWGPNRQVPMDKHTFIGLAHNIGWAKEMSVYLVETCERLGLEAAAKKGVPAREMDSFMNSYLAGIAGKVCWRLWTKRKEMEQKVTPMPDGTNLPALIHTYTAADEKNKEFMDSKFTHQKKARGPQVSDNDAQMMGHRDGDRVSLDRQLGSDRSGQARIGKA